MLAARTRNEADPPDRTLGIGRKMHQTLTSEATQLVDARSMGGQVVRLKFKDGRVFDLDLSPDLESLAGPLVEPLKDPLVFAKLEIKYGALLFPTGLDYGPDILRVWCENGSVEGQEVTDKLARSYLEGAASSLQHV